MDKTFAYFEPDCKALCGKHTNIVIVRSEYMEFLLARSKQRRDLV